MIISKNPNIRSRDCARRVNQTRWERRMSQSIRQMRLPPWALSLLVFAFAMARCLGAEARGAKAFATVTNGSVDSIVITDSGSGYVESPKVTLFGGGGSGASAAAQVSNGAVTNIILLSPGSGYTNAPTVAIDPPPTQIVPAVLSISLVPKLVLTGQAWQVQQIQYTDQLGDSNQWLTLTNIVMGQSPYVFVDLSAPAGGTRFYRVVTIGAPGPDPTRWAWINPGTFTMGSPDTEYDRSADEGPQTQVTLSRGFWMERFEVTQGEYTSLTGTNPAVFMSDTNQPVERVSWYDASNYCALLTAREQAAGRAPAGYVYRLPTEAEWEYTARAGTTNRFFFGDDHAYTGLTNYAWFGESVTNGTTHDVGGKQPNQWGLYDTSGNLFEWCADWYGPYSGGAVTNPPGPAYGTNRVMRGGAWHSAGGDNRSAARNFNVPDFAGYGIGFRVVLGPPAP